MKPITPERLHQIETCQVEASNLMEMLAIDYSKLWRHAFPDIDAPTELPKSITQKMQALGKHLHDTHAFEDILSLSTHRSDSVRGFACYAIAQTKHTLEEKLTHITPFADDKHSGVREWAWLALRHDIAEKIDKALELLIPWASNPSPFIRRFASESTRPRGVWCKHISALRQNPALAINLLHPLQNDPHKYVQDSVANWLNDAGKDHPTFVKDLCGVWKKNHPDSRDTARIIKRAQRNLTDI